MPCLSPLISSLLVMKHSNILYCLNGTFYILFLEDQSILIQAPAYVVILMWFYFFWFALRLFHYETNAGFCAMKDNKDP